MSKAAKSMFVFGLYLVIVGLGLMVAPNTALGLFGVAETNEPYIRLVGMLSLVLAYFYLRAASLELTPFFHWTVHTRLAAMVLFVAFVILDVGEPPVLLFGVADVAGAIWTYLALRQA